MQQQVVVENVKVQQIEKQEQIKVQEAEIVRHERSSSPPCSSPPRSSVRASRLSGRREPAPHDRSRGPRCIGAREGDAEAEVIFKKGDAEARAMNVQAVAYLE